MHDTTPAWSAQDVDAAKALLDGWRAATAALAALRKGARTAKLEVRDGGPWVSAQLDPFAAECALNATIAKAEVGLAALGVAVGKIEEA